MHSGRPTDSPTAWPKAIASTDGVALGDSSAVQGWRRVRRARSTRSACRGGAGRPRSGRPRPAVAIGERSRRGAQTRPRCGGRERRVGGSGAPGGSDRANLLQVRHEPFARFMAAGQAEPRLVIALDRGERLARGTSVRGVGRRRHGARVTADREQGADGIHVPRIRAEPTSAVQATATPEPAKKLSRRRPIFPGSCPPSIFGAGELNFRVRDGNGWSLSASVTGIIFNCDPRRHGRVNRALEAPIHQENPRPAPCWPREIGQALDR